jgi:hypothetical protein
MADPKYENYSFSLLLYSFCVYITNQATADPGGGSVFMADPKYENYSFILLLHSFCGSAIV